ncbi:Ig-like domain-containing protein, partial [Pseudomonas brenneri]
MADKDGHFSHTTADPQPKGEVSVVAKDATGNTSAATVTPFAGDTTAPAAPAEVKVTSDDQGRATISGKAEAGSTVEITLPDGKTVPVVADKDGHFSHTTADPQPKGEVSVVAKDATGNTSSATVTPFAGDTTAPAAPAEVKVTSDDQGRATISGKAEAGSTVEITLPDGTTTKVMADKDGHFSHTTADPQPKGEVSVVAKDATGNTSAATVTPFAGDTTAPAAPAEVKVTSDDQGRATISGKAEAGSTVEITLPDGTTTKVMADKDGHFSHTTADPQPKGEVSVVAKDATGNTSAATVTPFAGDTTAPAAPAEVKVTSDDQGRATISGNAEAGSTVEITLPDGKTVPVVADKDGHFSHTTADPQPKGEVSVVAKDATGNTSSATVTPFAGDTTAPAAPAEVKVTSDDQGRATISGKAEAGSTVEITLPDGKTVPVVADKDGHFSHTTADPQPKGEVSVVAKDATGNTSSATVTPFAGDTTAP